MIISLSGRIGCGKDTAADYLVEKYGYTRFAFADTLKDVLSVVFSWDRNLLNGTTVESRIWRETVDVWWSERLMIGNFTPRMAMTMIGTDLFRQHFNDSIWIASLERKISEYSNVVITDSRFKNELMACKLLGAKMVRIERGMVPYWYDYVYKGEIAKLNQAGIHISEYDSVDFQYDQLIQNTMLESFYGAIDSIV